MGVKEVRLRLQIKRLTGERSREAGAGRHQGPLRVLQYEGAHYSNPFKFM